MTTSGLFEGKNCLSRINTDTSSVSLTSAIDDLILQHETGIVVLPGDYDTITRITRQYGAEPFYASVAALNTYFTRADVMSLINAGDYPLLSQRVNTDVAFTPIEVGEFITNYGYTPIGLSTACAIVSNKIAIELESFYVGNFSSNTMGGFCSLLPNIFGSIDLFFGVLGGVANLVNKLKNFSLNFSLKALLAQLKNQITKVIDKVVDKVKNVIQNFSLDNIISNVASVINESIASQFQVLKETAMKFFDAASIESFKKKIESLIDYAVNIFKNPSLEEIQFILYRFCSFMSAVEDGINDLKRPLDTYSNSYKDTVSILQASSAGNTVRAVRAGGIRFTAEVQQTGITLGYELTNSVGNTPPLTPEDYKNIVNWNDGAGEPARLTFDSSWSSVLGRDGWERIDPKVRAMLMKVQKDFGRPLHLNSGFRPKWYNTLVGGALDSQHVQGLACDCSWGGINNTNKEEFIRIARYHGFRGIGRYGTFVHIDRGPERSW